MLKRIREKAGPWLAEGRRLGDSKFAKDATLLLALNSVSRGIAFFATSYAARCLGPAYFGISNLVQTTAGQVSLLFEGGFQVTGVRKIASDKAKAEEITALIVTFRLAICALLCAVWLVFALFFAPEGQRLVWSLGAISLFLLAANLTITFQGLERLPEQAFINTAGVALMAAAYFSFFKPGMFLGADLLVISAAGLLTTAAIWVRYRREFGRLPFRKIDLARLLAFLRESKLYWIRSLVGTGYPAVQIFLVAALVGARELGIYRSALAMAAAVEFLAASISALILSKLVTWERQGPGFMWRQQNKLLLVLCAISLPVTALIMALTPFVYSALFGPEYMDGALLLQIVIVGKLVVFLGQSYSWGLVAVRLDGTVVRLTFVTAGLSLALNAVLIPLYGVKGAALGQLSTDVFFPVACYFYQRAYIKKALGKV